MRFAGFGRAAVIAVGLSSGLASSASGACLTMTFDGYGVNKIVGVHFGAGAAWNAATASSFSGVHTGQYNFSIFGKSYSLYCAQLFEGVGPVGTPNTWCEAALADVPDAPPSPGPMGALRAQLVQDLYARYYAGLTTSSDAVQHAAFQSVIWEITHENFNVATVTGMLAELDLTRGAMQIDGVGNFDVLSAANTMIDALGDGGWRTLGSNLFGLTSASLQDQLIVVPLPAPALLAGIGLLGAFSLRRRMK